MIPTVPPPLIAALILWIIVCGVIVLLRGFSFKGPINAFITLSAFLCPAFWVAGLIYGIIRLLDWEDGSP